MKFFTAISILGAIAFASADPQAPAATPAPSSASASATCTTSYTETCYVTVTASAPYAAGNATQVTGTGSAATPSKAYYSNAANPLHGGALAVGAGFLGAILL